MSKKTLAFTIYNLTSGGAERVLTTLANELSESYEVLIITLTECDSFYALKKEVKLLNCGLPTAPKNPLSNLLAYYKTVKKIKNILKFHSVDTVISFTTTVNIFSILAARRAKVKCIISERNNPYVRIPNFLWKNLRNTLYKKADALVVQTIASTDFFSELMPKNKIVIIPNPLAKEVTDKRIVKEPSSENDKIILSVGRLDSNKAQDVLIRAFSNIENEGWKVQLVGEGNQMKNYLKIADTLGISKQIKFLGNQKNVWDFYNKAAIFVFTSRSEGFPNSLTEALYFGLPTISTNCPNGPSELISDGENGFLIPVDDQVGLEKKLTLLLNDVDLQKRFSKEARRRTEQFETDKIVAQWVDLLKEVQNS